MSRYNEDEHPPVEIEDCICIRTTPAACLVKIGSGPQAGKQMWIPQSQIHADSEVYNEESTGTLIVEEWIAIKRGLV